MQYPPKRLLTTVAALIAILGGAVGLVFMPAIKHAWATRRQDRGVLRASAAPEKPRVELVEGQPATISVAADVRQAMGIAVAEVRPAPNSQPLSLDGTLYLDTNSIVHLHSRFAGDVVEIGAHVSAEAAGDVGAPSAGAAEHRPVQFGDRVRKGNLLAVVWSKELGEKKSELVEDLSRLRLSQVKLDRLQDLYTKGATTERNLHEAEREVEADMISVERTERTLRLWRLSEPEIAAIRAEAERVRLRQGGTHTTDLDENWARVEVRSPIDGTVVEKNIAVGDYISNELDIFKIADLGRMDVLAHCYEDDLPALEQLPSADRRWTISLKADPKAQPLQGRFDRIGNIIDPNQHTAMVMGWVDNSSGRLRVGQFVTARVQLPTPPGQVAVPVAALIDQDGISYVLVQSDSDPSNFTRHRVYPVRRYEDFVVLDCRPDSPDTDKQFGSCRLQTGDRVVTTGAVPLAAEIAALQAAAGAKVTNYGR